MTALLRARQLGYLVRGIRHPELTPRWLEWCWTRRIPYLEGVAGPSWGRLTLDLTPAGREWTEELHQEALELLEPYLTEGVAAQVSTSGRLRVDRLPVKALPRVCAQLWALVTGDECVVPVGPSMLA